MEVVAVVVRTTLRERRWDKLTEDPVFDCEPYYMKAARVAMFRR